MPKGIKRTPSTSAGESTAQFPATSTALAPEPYESNGVIDDDRGEDYRERIAMRAYELYLARGGADGGDFDDWLAAEREITGGSGTTSPRGDAGE